MAISKAQSFRVDQPDGEIAGNGDLRLDRYLARALGLSRAEVRRLLDVGGARLNGQSLGRRDKGRSLKHGDLIEVADATPQGEQFPEVEPDAELRVLGEGSDWVAVDKDPGRVVHPMGRGERGSILAALLGRYPEIAGVGEAGLRSGVVHRLDLETSGVLLFARSQRFWRAARAIFSEGRAQKRYRALVAGDLRGEGTELRDLYVATHRPARVRVAAASDSFRTWRVEQRYRALESFDGATLVEIAPKTGFLHQIRVTMAEMGHPLLGDALYGGPSASRVLLHAAALRLPDLDVDVECDDPPDFLKALEGLRLGD